MSTREKFTEFISELVRIDRTDLDYGVYRVLRERRTRILEFVERTLPAAIEAAAGGVGDVYAAQELQRLEEAARTLGQDPNQNSRVLELRARLEDTGSSEDFFYTHLFRFFRRYWRRGDFISARQRGRDNVYVLPYDGAEVRLHWATAEQYFVKEAETRSRFAYRLGDGRRVQFQVTEWVVGNDRCHQAIGKPAVDDGTLVVPFRFAPANEGVEAARQASIAHIEAWEGWADWAHDLKPRLREFSSRERGDYFIHRDLRGFLRSELDNYLRDEALELLDTSDLRGAVQRLQAFRGTASALIDMVAQIEDFQRRLWLRRKFVKRTRWLVTGDRVPPALRAAIEGTPEQVAQWERDYGHVPDDFDARVVDTGCLDHSLGEQVLAAIDDIDTATVGVAIHGENFQALNLLDRRFRGEVDCIYVDPPYNTGENEFPYKDGFQHSSWLSLIRDRMQRAIPLLSPEGTLFVSCDDAEQHRLRAMMDDQGNLRFLANLVWKSRDQMDSRNEHNISNDHEFVMTWGAGLRGGERDHTSYSHPDGDPNGPWANDNLVGLAERAGRPNLHYWIEVRRASEMPDRPIDLLVGPAPGDDTLVFACVRVPEDDRADRVLWWGGVPVPLDGRTIHPGTYPCANRGWRWSSHRLARAIVGNEVLWPSRAGGRIRQKAYLRRRKSEYTGFSSSIGYTADGTRELQALFGSSPFPFPKPQAMVRTLIQQGAPAGGWVVDFFAGSGPVAQAVIDANRAGEPLRRFVVVELGEYFDTVLAPRIRKALHSDRWSAGQPIESNPTSGVVQLLELESYEEALDAVVFQEQSLDLFTDAGRRGYQARSFLAREGGEARLDPSLLERPFDEGLDVVETFNWLVGLRPRRYIRTEGDLRVEGRLGQECAVAVWVQGTEPTDLPDAGFHKVWINADLGHPTAVLTQQEFVARMFDDEAW